jgi:hypothetical protein
MSKQGDDAGQFADLLDTCGASFLSGEDGLAAAMVMQAGTTHLQ